MNEQICSISRALGSVEKHLGDDISVGDMAAASGYSLFYFIRLFNQFTHHTPYDYLIRRRLAQAAGEVLSTRKRLIDIALDYRFQNAETFSRAFYRVYQIQPSQLRKGGKLDERLMLTARTQAHLVHFQYGISLKPVIQQRPERFIAGIPIIQDGFKVSRQELIRQCKPFVPEGAECTASVIIRKEDNSREKSWVLGYEISDIAVLPLTLIAQKIPAGRYAVFTHSGSIAAIPLSLDYVYQTWLMNMDEHIEPSIEIYQFPLGETENIYILFQLK